MERFAKIVDCIQPLTIFAKHFISFVSQGYGYASDKTIEFRMGTGTTCKTIPL